MENSPLHTEIKPDLEAYKFENRIGEIRRKTVPIVNIRADWNEHEEGKKVYEAEKGWIIFSYDVKVPSKSDRANYGVDKRGAGSDFAHKETVEKIAQELIDYSKEQKDDKSKERLETFFRSYSDFYQHIQSSQSRLEFSYNIKGSGKFYNQYGGWLEANWTLEEARIISPDEAQILKYKIMRAIDEGKELDSLIVDPNPESPNDA